jgi:anti-sigma factor RsiW
MKECWDEGGLRAYLDRELPPEEMTQIAVHLGGCAECHTRYNELAGRAARVAALMEALEVRQGAVPSVPVASAWTKARTGTVATAILALAAVMALAFVLLAKRTEAPKPVMAPHIAPARPVMEQAALPEAKLPEVLPARAKSAKRAKRQSVEYYLALDNEPIDAGVVMRVALNDSAVQADVIFDADGRPRAIRTVK